jgi:hypothetical protein
MSSMARRMIRSLPEVPLDLAGVEEHDAPADGGEIVLHLVVVEGRLLGKDGLEELPQLGDVPLLVAEVVDELALRSPRA